MFQCKQNIMNLFTFNNVNVFFVTFEQSSSYGLIVLSGGPVLAPGRMFDSPVLWDQCTDRYTQTEIISANKNIKPQIILHVKGKKAAFDLESVSKCPGVLSEDVFTHGVTVGVVLQSVLPDQVCVCHKVADGDVLVLVDVAEQRGEVHGLPDHHHVVWNLRDTKTKTGRHQGVLTPAGTGDIMSSLCIYMEQV